jgi:peptidase E
MPERARPILLAAGGRQEIQRRGPNPLLHYALGLAGVAQPTVAYIGAASGDSTPFRLLIGHMLKRAGAKTVLAAPLCGRHVDVDHTRAVLADADLVFVSGGDVDEGMRVVHERGLATFLGDLYRAGKPFCGVSAGSIMLAQRWVRWRDPDDDASAELFDCLGCAPLICDTHSEDDGWQELQAATRLCAPGTRTYGIPSGAALLVEPDGSLRALGGDVHSFECQGKNAVQVVSVPPSD